jgi:hypothetical protein
MFSTHKPDLPTCALYAEDMPMSGEPIEAALKNPTPVEAVR